MEAQTLTFECVVSHEAICSPAFKACVEVTKHEVWVLSKRLRSPDMHLCTYTVLQEVLTNPPHNLNVRFRL